LFPLLAGAAYVHAMLVAGLSLEFFIEGGRR
jgi:glycerol-3-phosphate O-acyltransferase